MSYSLQGVPVRHWVHVSKCVTAVRNYTCRWCIWGDVWGGLLLLSVADRLQGGPKVYKPLSHSVYRSILLSWQNTMIFHIKHVLFIFWMIKLTRSYFVSDSQNVSQSWYKHSVMYPVTKWPNCFAVKMVGV